MTAEVTRSSHWKRRVVLVVALFAAVVVLLTVWPLFRVIVGAEPLFHRYSYESDDGGFRDFEMPEKGRTWTMIAHFMDEYRSRQGRDVVFYRTFERDPGWRWWRSSDDFYRAPHPRWDLPYRAAMSDPTRSR